MTRPIAPVEYLGVQSGCGVMPDFALWNTVAPFCGHCAGATLTAETIHALGYDLPNEAANREAQVERQRKKDSHNPFYP